MASRSVSIHIFALTPGCNNLRNKSCSGISPSLGGYTFSHNFYTANLPMDVVARQLQNLCDRLKVDVQVCMVSQ